MKLEFFSDNNVSFYCYCIRCFTFIKLFDFRDNLRGYFYFYGIDEKSEKVEGFLKMC